MPESLVCKWLTRSILVNADIVSLSALTNVSLSIVVFTSADCLGPSAHRWTNRNSVSTIRDDLDYADDIRGPMRIASTKTPGKRFEANLLIEANCSDGTIKRIVFAHALTQWSELRNAIRLAGDEARRVEVEGTAR